MESEKYQSSTDVVAAADGLPQDVSIAVQPLMDVAEPIVTDNEAVVEKPLVDVAETIQPLAEKPTSVIQDLMQNYLRGPPQDLASRDAQHSSLTIAEKQYYMKIINAISGSDKVLRNGALFSLATNVFFSALLPNFCEFITVFVKYHIGDMNFQMLINLMNMVKSLLDNKSLTLDAFLDQLVPAILCCCLTSQLSLKKSDNHWAFRDFTANLIAKIYKNYNSSTIDLQTLIKNFYCKAFQDINNVPLASLYGSISGLSRLGDDIIKDIILPNVKLISSRIENHLTENNGVDVDRISTVLQKYCTPILKEIREKHDLDEYINDYGCIGRTLYNSVVNPRPHNVAATPKHDIENSKVQTTEEKPKPTEEKKAICGAKRQHDGKLIEIEKPLQQEQSNDEDVK